MQVQSCCFSNLNYCFLATLVAVAVVVANVRGKPWRRSCTNLSRSLWKARV